MKVKDRASWPFSIRVTCFIRLPFFFLFICLSLQCLNIIRQTKEHIYVKWLILIGEQWIDLTTKYCVHSQTLIELITVSKNKIPTMSHNVALNDTVLHYDAHGHCSLFYKPVPHIPVCCKYLIESQICINTWLKIATNRCSNVSFHWSAVLVNNLVHFFNYSKRWDHIYSCSSLNLGKKIDTTLSYVCLLNMKLWRQLVSLAMLTRYKSGIILLTYLLARKQIIIFSCDLLNIETLIKFILIFTTKSKLPFLLSVKCTQKYACQSWTSSFFSSTFSFKSNMHFLSCWENNPVMLNTRLGDEQLNPLVSALSG